MLTWAYYLFCLHSADEIESRRYQAIEALLSPLYNLLKSCRSSAYVCPLGNDDDSFLCGCVLFGALTKWMDSTNLPSNRPEIPFFGHNIDFICENMRSIKSVSWYEYKGHRKHDCHLDTVLSVIADEAIKKICGLSLNDEPARNESAE